MRLIVDALKLKNDQVVYDLGAGDGVVIFEAARSALKRELTTTFVACEINPYLLLIMHLRRLTHPNRHRISIARTDIFAANYQPSTINHQCTFFTYISPWYMEKTVANVARQLKKGKSVNWVSYFYKAPKSQKYTVKQLSHTKNVHDIYRYTITRS